MSKMERLERELLEQWDNADPEKLNQYLEEVKSYGFRAGNAHRSFLKDFFAGRRVDLFENFQDTALGDKKKVMELKRTIDLLNSLEEEVLTVIETGKLAARRLAGDDEEQSNG